MTYKPSEHGHVRFKCQPECGKHGCWYCEGGLYCCTRCGGLEGGVPTDCPGETMDYNLIEDVYNGRKDFRNGKWVDNVRNIVMGGPESI